LSFSNNITQDHNNVSVLSVSARKFLAHNLADHFFADESMLRDAAEKLGRLHEIDQNEAQRKAAARE
jgi:hypothetical protein